MNRKSRILAMLLAVLVAFSLASSVGLMAAEAQHDCMGEHCPICCLLAQLQENIRLGLLVITAVAAAVLTYMLLSSAGLFAEEGAACTLVSLKVKLSD